METSELTKEEILRAKYANDKWQPNFEGILEVMDKWAKIYHKEKLREELVSFARDCQGSTIIIPVECVDNYLKQKQ